MQLAPYKLVIYEKRTPGHWLQRLAVEKSAAASLVSGIRVWPVLRWTALVSAPVCSHERTDSQEATPQRG